MDLQTGTSYIFEFQNIVAPWPLESVQNSMQITYSDNFAIKRTYVLNSSPSLKPAPYFGTEITCDSVEDIKVGLSGKVECNIVIPFQTESSPFTSIKINFKNLFDEEIEIVYPECEAYGSVPAMELKGQLSCSREDSDATHPSIRVSGFEFDPSYTVNIKVKARMMSNTYFTIDVLLQTNINNVYYTMREQKDRTVNLNTYMELASKFLTSFN